MRNQAVDRTWLFENAPVPKAMLTLALPTVISQIVAIIYNMADTYFVGQTNNPNAVAAISISLPVFAFVSGLANLFGIGGASLISRSLGAKKQDKARHVFAFCVWGSVLAAVIYAALIYFFRGPVIWWIGGDETTYAYVDQYLFWTIVVGAVPTILNSIFAHLIRATGATRQANLGVTMGSILNILLDPIIMFSILPPGNETIGAAIATMLSNIAAMCYFLIYLWRHRGDDIYTLSPRDISLKDHLPAEVLVVGAPAALSTFLALSSNTFANKFMHAYGAAAVAGIGVAKKITNITFNVNMGLSQGAMPLVGYSYGAKNEKRMWKTAAFTVGCACGFSIVCAILFCVLRTQLISAFIQEAETVACGTVFLTILCLELPLSAVTFTINMLFQATGKKLRTLLLSVMRKGTLDVLLMGVLSARLGAPGVVWATPLTELAAVVVAVILVVHFIRQNQSKEILK